MQSNSIFSRRGSRFPSNLLECLITRHPFGRPPERDPSYLNALLLSHIRADDPTTALLLFHRMRRQGTRLDSYTFPPVLAASSSLPGLARQVHALMIRTGCHSAPIPATALLDTYSKCGLPDDALSVFDEIPTKDVVAWNALLSCFNRHGLAGDAIVAFRSMLEDRVVITEFTLCSVLKSCTTLRGCQQGKQIHAQVAVAGCNSLVMHTALIDFYSSCGVVQDAITIFRRLDCLKDAAVYNALLSGLVRNGQFKEAFLMLGKMEPNGITLTCALSACSESLNLLCGKQIHCTMIRQGFDSDTILCNALVDMYSNCGEIKAAHLVFDRIGEKDVVSWTSIIDAYGSHGHGVEALKLFKNMEKGESGSASPNDVTYLSILSACGHSGLVDEGRNCFFLMRDKHGLDPGPEHYACVIDMFGRAHRIEEAWNLFCDVCADPSKLASAICVAMLNACRVSMDLVRGAHAAKHLLKLDPDDPSSYVLISNFYAAVGRWDYVEDLRRAMRARGLRKEAGRSQITENGLFANSDMKVTEVSRRR